MSGTSTVTRKLANRINENAAAGDRVSGNALNQRVRDLTGEKKRIMSIGHNNPADWSLNHLSPQEQERFWDKIEAIAKPEARASVEKNRQGKIISNNAGKSR